MLSPTVKFTHPLRQEIVVPSSALTPAPATCPERFRNTLLERDILIRHVKLPFGAASSHTEVSSSLLDWEAAGNQVLRSLPPTHDFQAPAPPPHRTTCYGHLGNGPMGWKHLSRSLSHSAFQTKLSKTKYMLNDRICRVYLQGLLGSWAMRGGCLAKARHHHGK